jgi:cytochrome b
MSGAIEGQHETRVWDPFVRIGHWTLAAAFATAWATGDEQASIHTTAGYVVLGIVLFRLVWGFVGTRHARFRDFVTGWRPVREHLQGLLQGEAEATRGHNPAGGWMVIALLVGLLGMAGSGYLMMLTGSEAFEDVHEGFANAMLALVLIHLGGALVTSLLTGENLVKAMLTGRKPATAKEEETNG